jgi:hypothetical protein
VYRGTEYPSTLYQSEYFDKMVLDIHNRYDCINLVLRRGYGNHNEKERYQSLEESKQLDYQIEKILIENKIPYYSVEVNPHTVNTILKLINV